MRLSDPFDEVENLIVEVEKDAKVTNNGEIEREGSW
jgi:hypothetical protein